MDDQAPPGLNPVYKAARSCAVLFVAGGLAPAGFTADDAEVAARSDCAAGARIEHTINVGTGVNNAQASAASPLTVTLGGHADATRYADCLRREGFDPRARVSASFERAAACGGRARTAGVHISSGTTTLGRDFDESAWRDCMNGDVEAEVVGIGDGGATREP